MPSTNRRKALNAIVNMKPASAAVNFQTQRVTEMFGINVFGDQQMRERLPKSSYLALREAVEKGTPLDPKVADNVATAMKEWAVERGATHYTHWFQPMTGLTAEKHDAFLTTERDRAIFEFSGKQLIKGEPDASSFPSGGIRNTFEARGYTNWDPTSPAFLKQGTNGNTLCIPTAFCSWTGEALDKKTPLLRSNQALQSAAMRMLRLLGDRTTTSVTATLGVEQEYFLIDRNFFMGRPDLVATGRTVLGARPPKGQELEDHYFGTITPRILTFMEEVEFELWKLGVPVKTRHNEVAPSQFELAPIFEATNIATDHNMLTMEVLRNVAQRHGMVCLLHEKPFAGVNGSGKHNNWSMATDVGDNLLDPGDTPQDNMRFLVFLTAIIRAVDVHADVLRIAIANAGNDHRLGANEAPPAIISIYLGEELDEVCRNVLVDANQKTTRARDIRLGVTSLPPLPRDTTDRNRTSPFAFTGNKFEFRAVGSSQSVATPITFLNSIVSESLTFLADQIEKHGGSVEAIQKVVQETLRNHYRVVFNGNNYSEEWHGIAAERGLLNSRNTVDALSHYLSEKNFKLFENAGVFSRREVQARATMAYEAYIKAIAIEAQACLELSTTSVLPAALCQQRATAESICATRATGIALDLSAQEQLLSKLTTTINELIQANDELTHASEHGHGEDVTAHALWQRDHVVPAMRRVRTACDRVETMVDDSLWPLPKYHEMLFLR